jgi:hypothetical protein
MSLAEFTHQWLLDAARKRAVGGSDLCSMHALKLGVSSSDVIFIDGKDNVNLVCNDV